MIRIIEGNPGSGKSYYAVNYIGKLGVYDGLYDEYVFNQGVMIVTNIEGFRGKHLSLDDCIEKAGGIEKFFTVDNIEGHFLKRLGVKHLVIIIDEAQKYFDSKFYDKDVFYFFQFHRHLGCDIFLLTQGVSTICRHFIPLCEFIVKAAPRSKGIVGTFRYKFCDTKGVFLYSKVIRKEQKLFGLYKSFRSDEAEKPKNVVSHWIIVCVVGIFALFVGIKGVLAFFKSGGNLVAKSSVSKTVKPVLRHYTSISPAAVPVASPSPVPVVARSGAAVPPPRAKMVKPDKGGVSPLPVDLVASSDVPRHTQIKAESVLEVNGSVWLRLRGKLFPLASLVAYDPDSEIATIDTKLLPKGASGGVPLGGAPAVPIGIKTLSGIAGKGGAALVAAN